MGSRRRAFLKSTVGAGAFAAGASGAGGMARPQVSVEKLNAAATRPILNVAAFKNPVKIASLELLRGRRGFFLRARSTDGAEGVAITNSRADVLYPILQKLVIPYFVGKDARQLEALLDGVYVHRSNYKLSGLALWCCVAWVEFALLDLLGKIAGKSVGDLLGGVVRRKVPVYYASGRRDTTPEQEVAILARRIKETGVHAVKFKVGGRMSNNADSIPGRTEGLIALVRKKLGDEITLHADANSSYDAR